MPGYSFEPSRLELSNAAVAHACLRGYTHAYRHVYVHLFTHVAQDAGTQSLEQLWSDASTGKLRFEK